MITVTLIEIVTTPGNLELLLEKSEGWMQGTILVRDLAYCRGPGVRKWGRGQMRDVVLQRITDH